MFKRKQFGNNCPSGYFKNQTTENVEMPIPSLLQMIAMFYYIYIHYTHYSITYNDFLKCNIFRNINPTYCITDV